MWSGSLLGGSQAHRVANPAFGQVLRLTTPHSCGSLFCLSPPLGFSCLITRLTLRTCPPEIPPFTLLPGGHVVVVLPHRVTGSSPRLVVVYLERADHAP